MDTSNRPSTNNPARDRAVDSHKLAVRRTPDIRTPAAVADKRPAQDRKSSAAPDHTHTAVEANIGPAAAGIRPAVVDNLAAGGYRSVVAHTATRLLLRVIKPKVRWRFS